MKKRISSSVGFFPNYHFLTYFVKFYFRETNISANGLHGSKFWLDILYIPEEQLSSEFKKKLYSHQQITGASSIGLFFFNP